MQRPNPEKLLRHIQEEERQEKRGKLKLYLGAAPGVGKTYTMLQDAITQQSQGLEVLVGIVESHGRVEIENLLKNLDVLPHLMVEYKNSTLHEFDIDAALKRNVSLILIDEMAHTNAPGLRHTKRWQDIKEVLDRGIDVYTTLNVQHIESLNDVIAQITHTKIKETVPDFMVELAHTIELVDLPPEDLLRRLQEGKIYFPEQAKLAKEHFFRKGNLTALRELALRVTAERVGSQVLLYRQDLGIKHIWPTKEKIMVCVGHRVESTKLIRAAKRMAVSLQAEWFAVHVDVPKTNLSGEAHDNAVQNLGLADLLGAETRILSGFDIVKEMMTFAREQNITQIVIGKVIRPRWKDFFYKNLADEIVRNSQEIDVYIITNTHEKQTPTQATVSPLPTKQPIPWKTYGIAIGMVMMATLVGYLFSPFLNGSNLIMLYLLGVTLVALFGQTGPSIVASILSVIAYECFLIQPLYNFVITDIQYFFTLCVMLLVTQVISHLTIQTRRQAEAARLSENQTAALHTLSRQLASSRGVDKLLDIGVKYVADFFESDVIALLNENNKLSIKARYKTDEVLNEKELSVAQWVYDLGQMAGLGTSTLPFSEALYVPLLTPQGSIGVLKLHPDKAGTILSVKQMRLLEACANQLALALEVDELYERAKKSELVTATDRVRNKLLQSVSHDLRTPLVAVMGMASTLIEQGRVLEGSEVRKLGNDIYFELEELSRLISNLLQMTYLEADAVKLEKKPHNLGETIQLAVKTAEKNLAERPVHLTIPADLPAISYDETLIEEVLGNLIDNAVKFTSANSAIDISVERLDDHVMVSVADEGPGIVTDEVKKLFEKFYRGRLLTSERGLGLGLAICRRIIKVHGGRIWAENRPSGGADFRFTLPLS